MLSMHPQTAASVGQSALQVGLHKPQRAHAQLHMLGVLHDMYLFNSHTNADADSTLQVLQTPLQS